MHNDVLRSALLHSRAFPRLRQVRKKLIAGFAHEMLNEEERKFSLEGERRIVTPCMI
jgi:hypothetical protein